MNSYLITYVSELGTQVYVKIEAETIALAVKAFLIQNCACGLTDAINFNVKKIQEN